MEGLSCLIMRALKGGELGHFLVPTRRSLVSMQVPGATHFNRRFYPMTHIEEAIIEKAIIEKLRSGGPCCLDDIVMHLSPSYSWSQIFVAVDRMSRNGGVLIRQLDYSTYQITLRPEVASPVQRRVAEGESASQSLEC